MNVGTLTISLTARTASLAKAAAHVKTFERGVVASVNRINTSIASVGMAFSALTIPIAALGISSTKMFADFEYELSRIESLVGKSVNQVQHWGREILNLAPKLGTSAGEMAKTLYQITTSNPYRDSKIQMELLEKATKAAEAGLGDAESVAKTAAYAMNAYGTANLSVSQAIDTVIFGVKEGVVVAEEYASALGQILPAAQKAGMGFNEVASAAAAITRTGNNAAQATTQIRRMLFTLVQDSPRGNRALGELNSSYAKLIDTIRTQGFLQMMKDIKSMTEIKGEEFMKDVFHNIRALLPIIDLLGENFEENVGIFERSEHIGGELERAWESYTKTMRYSLKTIFADAGVSMVEFGNQIKGIVIPILTSMVRALSNVMRAFINLDDKTKENVIRITLLVGTLGPLLLLFSSLVSVVMTAIKVALTPLRLAFSLLNKVVLLAISPLKQFRKLMVSIKAIAAANPFTLIAVGVFLLNTAIWSLVQSWDKMMLHLQIGWNGVIQGALYVVDWFQTFDWSEMFKKLKDSFKQLFEDIITWFKELPQKLEAAIDTTIDKLGKSKFGRFMNSMGTWGNKSIIPPVEDVVKEQTKQQLKEPDVPKLSKVQQLIKEGEEANAKIREALEGKKGFGGAFVDNIKRQFEPIIGWVNKKWDYLWSKLEPPSFSVPSGGYGPTEALKEETVDEFVKRMMEAGTFINDYIYDPFEKVDEIIQDTWGGMAELHTHSIRVGDAFDYIGESTTFLKKQIKAVDEEIMKTGGTSKQIEQLNQLRQELLDLELSQIWKDYQTDLDDVLFKTELLGTSYNSLEQKARVYSTSISAMQRMNIALWKDNQDALDEYIKKLDSLIKKQKDNARQMMIQNELAGGATDLLWTLGEAVTGVEDAYKRMGRIVVSVIESIVKYLLKEILLEQIKAIVKKNSADATMKDVVATEINTAAKEANAVASVLNTMATEGESAADMQDVGSKMADTIATGKNTVAKETNTIAKIGNAIASAIEWLVEKLGPLGLAAAVGAVGGIIALFSSGKKKAGAAVKMKDGGIVPPGYPNDTYPAFLSSGETVIPPHKLPDFSKDLNNSSLELKGEWRIKGRDLVYIFNEEQRRVGNVFG